MACMLIVQVLTLRPRLLRARVLSAYHKFAVKLLLGSYHQSHDRKRAVQMLAMKHTVHKDPQSHLFWPNTFHCVFNRSSKVSGLFMASHTSLPSCGNVTRALLTRFCPEGFHRQAKSLCVISNSIHSACMVYLSMRCSVCRDSQTRLTVWTGKQ